MQFVQRQTHCPAGQCHDYGKGNGSDYGMMRMMRMQHTALHSHNAMLLDNPRDIMDFFQIYMLSPVRGSSTYDRPAM